MIVTRLRVVQGLAAASTSPWWLNNAEAQNALTVKVGVIPIEPAALIYYAMENGFLKQAGLEVDVTQNASTPAIAAAVASGTYDIAYGTISTLAIAHVRGLQFVCIAPGVGWVPGVIAGAIMVPTASTLQTAKDFNGKTLATAGLGTIAEYLPRAWIDKHGGDSSTVKFIEIPFPLTTDAMTSGRVDAAYMVEPFITLDTKKRLARIFITGDEAIGPRYTATGWYSTAQWAKANPDTVSRFSSAMLQAARWANANPTKDVPILAKYLHVDPAVTADANRSYYPERLTAADIQPWVDVTARYAKFATFPAAEMLYVPGRP